MFNLALCPFLSHRGLSSLLLAQHRLICTLFVTPRLTSRNVISIGMIEQRFDLVLQKSSHGHGCSGERYGTR
jgi:hypothetical protein